jgi:hypothetical protein
MPDSITQPVAVPEVKCPTLLAVRVVCAADASHPVRGLFVVFRPKPPTGEAKKLCPSVEGVDDSAPGAMFLGIVGQDGFLQPVHVTNPWHDLYAKTDPHSYKVSPIQKYEGCLVRHPDPDVVRAFVTYLRTGEGAARFEKSWGERDALIKDLAIELDTAKGDQLVLKVPEQVGAYVPKGGDRYDGWTLFRDMPHAQCKGVEKVVRQLQDDLALMRFPVGSQESPYAPVKRSEKKPSPDQNRGVFDGKVQATVARFQEHACEGNTFEIFEVAKAAAKGGNAYAFLLGEPRRYEPSPALAQTTLGLVDSATTKEIASWLELGRRKPGNILLPLSSDIGAIWMLEQGAVACDAWSQLLIAFGSYDLRSGHSFRNVLDKGSGNGKRLNSIHKTGLAIDFSGGGTARTRPQFPVRFEAHWMRADPTLSSKQQSVDKATKGEGNAKVKRDEAEHSRAEAQRKLDADKQKLEADGATADTKKITADRYAVSGDTSKLASSTAALERADKALEAAHKKLEDAQKALRDSEQAAKDDEAGAKEKWTILWRLYSHSRLDIFGPSADYAFDALRQALVTYPDDLAAHFRRQFGDLGKTAEANAWIDQAIAPARSVAKRLAAYSNNQLAKQYFRKEVWQWIYNHYEVDGGSRSAKPWPPDYVETDFPPSPFPDPKSYINITALGALLEMARISGRRVKDTSLGKDGKVVTAQFALSKAAGTVAQLLVYLKTLPDQRHANDDITVFRKRTKLVAYKPAAIDAMLMKDWLEGMPSMLPDARKHEPLVVGVTGFDLWITLAVSKSGTSVVEKVIAVLGQKQFSEKRFVVVTAGKLSGVVAATIVNGRTLQTTLEDALRRFKNAVEQQAAANAEAAKQQQSKGKGNKSTAKPKPVESTKKDLDDWRVTFRPVFAAPTKFEEIPFAPGDDVSLPAPKSANLEDLWRPLEWWHYQHEDAAGVTWGDLVRECGFSKAILAGDDPPGDSSSIVPLGVGYHEGNFHDTNGGCRAGTVENGDEPPNEFPIGG